MTEYNSKKLLGVNQESKEPTRRPSLLDVIRIDGRLAQVIVGGDHIKFLDDGSVVEINWDEYNFKEPAKYRTHISDLVRENQIKETEFQVIHWGPEQEEKPQLRNFVTFFGIYTKK